jgi:hypothetical protein
VSAAQSAPSEKDKTMPDTDTLQPLGLVAAASSQTDATAKAPRSGRSAKKRKFYEMDYVTVSTPGGYELMNKPALFPAGARMFLTPEGRRGFREYAEMPLFRFDSRLGRAIRDMEPLVGFWLVSDRAKTVLEQVDTDAFAFLECRVELRDGSEGPRYWLCDVVRVLDALNESESEMAIEKNDRGEKIYTRIGAEILLFKEDVIGARHIFRMQYRDSTVICDDTMKDTCKAAGLKGWRFRDTSRHSF